MKIDINKFFFFIVLIGLLNNYGSILISIKFVLLMKDFLYLKDRLRFI